jgi:hypothetical protein
MRKYLVAAAAAPLLAASSGVLRRPKIRGVRTYDVGLQSCEWWTAHIEDRDKKRGDLHDVLGPGIPIRGRESIPGPAALHQHGSHDRGD